MKSQPVKPQHLVSALAHSSVRSVALNAFALGLLLALFLHYAEQAYPIQPRWIFLEVIAGTLCALTPPALAARRGKISDWRIYERLVAMGFVASGLPIIVWQLALYWSR